MTEIPAVPHRPVTVNIAVALTYISGILNVVIGVIVLLSRYHVPEADVLSVSLLGAAITLLGLLVIGIASGLARGSHMARVVVTVYLSLQFALHIVTIVSADVWDWTEALQMILEAAVVVAVWTPPGARFFRRVAEAKASAANSG